MQAALTLDFLLSGNPDVAAGFASVYGGSLLALAQSLDGNPRASMSFTCGAPRAGARDLS